MGKLIINQETMKSRRVSKASPRTRKTIFVIGGIVLTILLLSSLLLPVFAKHYIEKKIVHFSLLGNCDIHIQSLFLFFQRHSTVPDTGHFIFRRRFVFCSSRLYQIIDATSPIGRYQGRKNIRFCRKPTSYYLIS